jgi:glycosyltransferase involved in cell wall biosynthesis
MTNKSLEGILDPFDVFPNDRYISIVVPTFCRPFYLKKLLETLFQFADMPFETIVIDDGSPEQAYRQEVFEMSHMISTLIFNNGKNMGLCAGPNRAISIASSKYILFLNDDCFFVKPCLRDICNALSRPYVGLVSPMDDPGSFADSPKCNINGTNIVVSSRLGGGSTIAFRKEVWKEIGGFNERSTSSQADNVFIYSMLRAGYWRAFMEGHDSVKVGNFVYGDEYKPTVHYTKGNDCSLPKIFGLTEEEYVIANHRKRECSQFWVEGQRTIGFRECYDGLENPVWGLNDIPKWGNYFMDIFGGKNSDDVREIDWEVAKIHGQEKWRGMIEKDFGLTKE